MLDLGTLGGTCGFAQCANNRGQVVGTSDLAGGVETHAFLWDRGVLTDLGTLGGTFSIPIWLSNAGEAVGAANTLGDQAIHASLWKNGVIADLGVVNGNDCSFANAINSRAQIVGASISCATGDERAFLWESGGPMVDLNTLIPANSSLRLAQAFNINDRGRLLAWEFAPVIQRRISNSGSSDMSSYSFLVRMRKSAATTTARSELPRLEAMPRLLHRAQQHRRKRR